MCLYKRYFNFTMFLVIATLKNDKTLILLHKSNRDHVLLNKKVFYKTTNCIALPSLGLVNRSYSMSNLHGKHNKLNML